MKQRVLTAAEITKLLLSQDGADEELDLGGGLKAVRMATKERAAFTIEREGKQLYRLDEADPAGLAELSGILWERLAPFVSSLEDDLVPDALKDKPEDDSLTPDELKDEPGDDPLAYPGDEKNA